MKKKILLCVLAIVELFTITGCGRKNSKEEGKSNHPNQTGYVEGKYFIDELTFNLYDGFKESFNENIYQLADDNNGIAIYFYHDKDIKTSIEDYINSDPHDFLPDTKNINPIVINGNEWYKGTTKDNAYLYYIKLDNDVYSIMILPMFTTKTTLNNVISTLENSLYFK